MQREDVSSSFIGKRAMWLRPSSGATRILRWRRMRTWFGDWWRSNRTSRWRTIGEEGDGRQVVDLPLSSPFEFALQKKASGQPSRIARTSPPSVGRCGGGK